jgi:DNA-binding NarL/FixJ family response regulator
LATLRIALLGGSDSSRAAKRSALETGAKGQVVFDSDGHGLLPQQFLEVNYDVAIVEQRLGSQSAFDYIRALHALAVVSQENIGRILVGSQFHETQWRITAIEAGAVDCVFVSDGIDSLIKKVLACVDVNADFAIRELLPQLGDLTISQEGFQNAAVALDTLDKKESIVVKSFCQLKDVSQIGIDSGLSKVKVNATLLKVQRLLVLQTRSQLLLRMYRLGALAF